MLSDASVSDALKGRLIATLGENPGPDVDKVMVAALAKSNSPALFDQILRRSEATTVLLAALKAKTITPATLGPANVALVRSRRQRCSIR